MQSREVTWRVAICFFYFSLAVLSPLCAQKKPLSKILELIIKHDALMHEKMKGYEYEQHVLTRKLNEAGQEIEKKELSMTVRPGARTLLSVVADKSGVVKTESEGAEEKTLNSRKMVTPFLISELLPRFEVWTEGETIWNGYPAYVLGFKPLADQKPFSNRMEKVLAHLAGKMWVSQTDYIILKTEAELSRSIDLAWFFASMRSMRLDYEAQRIEGLGFVPKMFKLDYEVRILTIRSRHAQIVTMSGHRPRGTSR
ncbi:MAG: hypothetical protein RML49_06210 [Verrucomicrobiae bacterium]|nr:hypothetical protein [Verrucomicrobiae bacterium]